MHSEGQGLFMRALYHENGNMDMDMDMDMGMERERHFLGRRSKASHKLGPPVYSL